MSSTIYRGRFAPSPTGPLHFGSLIAAVGSFLQAKQQGGAWLLRMEDLDTPRNVPGAAGDILRTLEAFGFEWEGEVVYQSQRGDLYDAALRKLAAQDAIFPCACSRREISDSSVIAVDGPIYPGTCRHGMAAGKTARAMRMRTQPGMIEFVDGVQGNICQDVAREVGDFVLRRADGVVAYQLAVVVDDAEQGISKIVRGADLLASTPRQIYLQRLLGYATPNYVHLPVATNAAGEKLSKQTLARAIDEKNVGLWLWRALDFLGQSPPVELRQASHEPLWAWALGHWSLAKVAKRTAIAVHEPRSRKDGVLS